MTLSGEQKSVDLIQILNEWLKPILTEPKPTAHSSIRSHTLVSWYSRFEQAQKKVLKGY